jgi:hypothetical protein
MFHAMGHDRGDGGQGSANFARVDRPTRCLVPRAKNRVGRRADAETTPLGGGKDSFAIQDGRRQRLLAVNVLSAFERGERHFSVRLGNGQVEDDVNVVALQKIGDTGGDDAMTVSLPLGSLHVDVGAGDNANVAKELRVDEVDF